MIHRLCAAAALLLVALAGSCADSTLPDDVGVYTFRYSGATSGTYTARGRIGPDPTWASGLRVDEVLGVSSEMRTSRARAVAGLSITGAGTGTYPLDEFPAPGVAIGSFGIAYTDGSYARWFSFTEGTLEITRLDDRRIRGKISGTLVAQDGSTVTMTNGSFDVPVTGLDGPTLSGMINPGG